MNAVVKARPRDPYVQLGKALLKASDGADAVAAVAAREILGSSGRPALEVVVDRLWALSKTGVAAVVHCRRGDKITNSKYCPAQMDKATSPARIAEVLDQSGIKPGSAIYIMSNELNLAHFDPLRDVYGYHFLTQAVSCVENIQ